MKLDDNLCLCFHVKLRKVVNFIRIENPQAPSQIADCFGAGTGCGWCRPFLKELFLHVKAGGEITDSFLPGKSDYANKRSDYVGKGMGTPPPGAEPIQQNPDED